MQTKDKEINLLDIQIVTTILYLGSLLLSIFLTLHDKQLLQNKKGIFTKKQSKSLSIFNRFFVLILTVIFLYVSYENFKITEKKGDSTKNASLQVVASCLSTIATIIVLYVVIESSGQDYSIISGVENPNL